jgi:DNA-directed RNA polymerase subunit L
MYLPLTGYKEKDGISDKMKIPPVGAAMTQNAVRPTQKAVSPQENAQKVNTSTTNDNTNVKSGTSKSEGPNAVEMHYSHSMSTESFMVLRTQSQNEPFKVLDEVIAKMKENMEEVGEAIETLSKMVEKTSKSNIALDILRKTFDAIDKMNGEE